MRQSMSKKNVNKYSKLLNLDIEKILVRGGTDHRKDLHLKDGTIIYLYPDGSMYKERENGELVNLGCKSMGVTR